jgi:regulator of CtrA degradation
MKGCWREKDAKAVSLPATAARSGMAERRRAAGKDVAMATHCGFPVATTTISFAQRLASSGAFKSLFREGMDLVEETAAYLDGPGRAESKALSRAVALAYASESMRLTTRLMQLASWLLLQRAVNEGEISQIQAATEKHKVRLARQELASSAAMFVQLPHKLQELTLQSLRLQGRIICLDEMIYHPVLPLASEPPHPLQAQFERLRSAFQVAPAPS